MPKINVSFKQTSRDMRMFLEVNSKEEKSEFVKDAVEFYIHHLQETEKKKPTKM